MEAWLSLRSLHSETADDASVQQLLHDSPKDDRWSASPLRRQRQPRTGAQELKLEDVDLGSESQLQQLALASGPQAAPLSAMSELCSLDLFASRPRLDVMEQLAALARHARQLTALTLSGGEVLTVTGRLAELAACLRLLPELRSLEVRSAT